jgi:deazaflavin-dependent oxidoreductase (nitroreductase family)
MADVGFPDVRWGSDSSVLRGPLTALASTKPGSWLVRTMTPLDRKLLVRSSGRFTVLGPIGAPILLLSTIGAKSGALRTSPLLFARDGGRLLVAGSNFGQEHHPAWTRNLIKNPLATVTIGGKAIAARAQLLEGDEAEAAYEQMVAITTVYDVYRGRTDRNIRVFSLTAV